MSPSAPFEQEFAIQCELRDGEHVIELSGEFDLGNAERVQQELGRVEGEGAESVVLDLSRLTFIDSTGLRVIIEADSRLRANECAWSIVPGPEAVQRVFELTGTDQQLPFRRRRAETAPGPPANSDETTVRE